MDDLELLRAYADRGESEAIRLLVYKHRAMVLATCRRHVPCQADAEDAMQEVFLSLLENAGAIKSNPAAWLRRCAVNAATLIARSRSRRTHWEFQRSRMAAFTPCPEQAAHNERLAILAGCLTELAPADRQVLLRNCVEGKTQRDIAASLGVSQQAVAKRIAKTLASLRRKLTSKGVILSLAAAIALAGRRAAQAAIPPAVHAAIAWAKTLCAASGPAAMGLATELKLTAATLVVVSAAAVYEHTMNAGLPEPTGVPAAPAAVAPAPLDGASGLALANRMRTAPRLAAPTAGITPQSLGQAVGGGAPAAEGLAGTPAPVNARENPATPVGPVATAPPAADTPWDAFRGIARRIRSGATAARPAGHARPRNGEADPEGDKDPVAEAQAQQADPAIAAAPAPPADSPPTGRGGLYEPPPAGLMWQPTPVPHAMGGQSLGIAQSGTQKSRGGKDGQVGPLDSALGAARSGRASLAPIDAASAAQTAATPASTASPAPSPEAVGQGNSGNSGGSTQSSGAAASGSACPSDSLAAALDGPTGTPQSSASPQAEAAAVPHASADSQGQTADQSTPSGPADPSGPGGGAPAGPPEPDQPDTRGTGDGDFGAVSSGGHGPSHPPLDDQQGSDDPPISLIPQEDGTPVDGPPAHGPKGPPAGPPPMDVVQAPEGLLPPGPSDSEWSPNPVPEPTLATILLIAAPALLRRRHRGRPQAK